MLQWLINLDTQLFLSINGFHNAYLDVLMDWISYKWTWLPFYALLIWFLVKKYKKKVFLSLFFVTLLITLSDRISSGFIKPLVHRLRPCHEPLLDGLVHVNGNCGGQYGFLSSHAANSFALAVFVIAILGKDYRWLRWFMPLWATLVAYSRVYNGVHYPGDVLCAAVLGILLGLLVVKAYSNYYNKKLAA